MEILRQLDAMRGQRRIGRVPWASASRALLALALAAAGVLAACEGANLPLWMSAPGAPVVPAVTGYAGGEEILFIHTEASDAAVADTLTAMMRSPVLVVPELASVPETALANVYVFMNGPQPRGDRGPFDYQPDVFDCVPREQCYRPLRAVNLVRWEDGAETRVLRSAQELLQAEERGELHIERPGAVVNMPFLTWPGGER